MIKNKNRTFLIIAILLAIPLACYAASLLKAWVDGQGGALIGTNSRTWGCYWVPTIDQGSSQCPFTADCKPINAALTLSSSSQIPSFPDENRACAPCKAAWLTMKGLLQTHEDGHDAEAQKIKTANATSFANKINAIKETATGQTQKEANDAALAKATAKIQTEISVIRGLDVAAQAAYHQKVGGTITLPSNFYPTTNCSCPP